ATSPAPIASLSSFRPVVRQPHGLIVFPDTRVFRSCPGGEDRRLRRASALVSRPARVWVSTCRVRCCSSWLRAQAAADRALAAEAIGRGHLPTPRTDPTRTAAVSLQNK